MQGIQINLVPWHWQTTVDRQFILTQLPRSLLAQALEGDPNAPEISITNPLITPEIVEAVFGVEPPASNPQFRAAADYLNIPWLSYYSSPLYNAVVRPVGIPFEFKRNPGALA